MNQLMTYKELIKHYLISEIKKKKPHDRIMSEQQLANKFNVCRLTARGVMQELVIRGYLYTISSGPGNGYYISKKRVR